MMFSRIRWFLAARHCGCGETRLHPGTTVELGGVRHRTDGPCFHCDEYGQPL
jgi:hypothetical protein